MLPPIWYADGSPSILKKKEEEKEKMMVVDLNLLCIQRCTQGCHPEDLQMQITNDTF